MNLEQRVNEEVLKTDKTYTTMTLSSLHVLYALGQLDLPSYFTLVDTTTLVESILLDDYQRSITITKRPDSSLKVTRGADWLRAAFMFRKCLGEPDPLSGTTKLPELQGVTWDDLPTALKGFYLNYVVHVTTLKENKL